MHFSSDFENAGMQAHEKLLQDVAAATVATSADDLQGLAKIHALIEAFRASVPPTEPWSAIAATVSSNAGALLEKMILSEIADCDAALRQVGDMTTELIKLAQQVHASDNLPPPPEPSASPEPAAAIPAAGATKEDVIDPNDSTLVAEFILEAGEHVEASEAALLKLDQDAGDTESINALFRAFHTIKGVAGFIRLGQIGSLAHAVENLMDQARSGSLRLGPESIDALLKAVDLMKVMIAALDQALSAGAKPPVQSGLPAMISLLHDCANGTAPKVSAPVPAAQPMPATEDAEIPSPANKPTESRSAAAATQSSSESVVKVSTERLDSLINAIGELVIAQAMVSQDVASLVPASHRVVRELTQVGKIARELQDLSMSMRMVPIQGVFQKMSRLARDLARKSGKEFDLELIGGETELDRGLVEAVSDPLVHMVRNAADHGIECPDDREKAGKPRAGKIQLRAYHQAGNVVVEIKDDGRGLNKAKILKKAQDRGIVPPGKELSEQEIFKLIMCAGLSTADKVTDVSGRGVGMDVVLRNVESLRGRIDIESQEGQGSTFTIRLPLTLAVIDGLVVRVGDQRYVIPITSIEQSLRPKPSQISTIRDSGEMCMVRDHLVPVVRLHRLFGVQPVHETITDAILVIVQSGPLRCSLMVDELLGQQQVVIKSLGDSLGPIAGVSGGAILGDGNVCLILDAPGIIMSASGDPGFAAAMQS